MQREADKEEWSGASVAPIPRCVSPHAQWYLRSPLHVTSVIAHIFELAAWASAVGRQSSFDFKNDSSNSKLWVTPTFAFELCFFFSRPKPNKKSLTNLTLSIVLLREGAHFLSPVSCWVRFTSFSYHRTMEMVGSAPESFLRQTNVHSKGLNCLCTWKLVNKLLPSVGKITFPLNEQAENPKNSWIILNGFLCLVHHSIVIKEAVDPDRDTEMSTFCKKEKIGIDTMVGH